MLPNGLSLKARLPPPPAPWGTVNSTYVRLTVANQSELLLTHGTLFGHHSGRADRRL